MKTTLAILSMFFTVTLCDAAERTFARLIDVDGNYIIDVDANYITTLTAEIGTFTIGPSGDFVSYSAAESSGLMPGDTLTQQGDITEAVALTTDGAETDLITVNGNGFSLTCSTSCTFGGNWWTFYNLNIVGSYEVTGDNVTFNRHMAE